MRGPAAVRAALEGLSAQISDVVVAVGRQLDSAEKLAEHAGMVLPQVLS